MRELASILYDAANEWAGEFAPDFNDILILPSRPREFEGDANLLFAPLLSWAIERVDFETAAKHILAHVNQLA